MTSFGETAPSSYAMTLLAEATALRPNNWLTVRMSERWSTTFPGWSTDHFRSAVTGIVRDTTLLLPRPDETAWTFDIRKLDERTNRIGHTLRHMARTYSLQVEIWCSLDSLLYDSRL